MEETSHHELMALQERKAKAQQFRERTQALSSAVGVLEEAIDVSKSKVRHRLPDQRLRSNSKGFLGVSLSGMCDLSVKFGQPANCKEFLNGQLQ